MSSHIFSFAIIIIFSSFILGGRFVRKCHYRPVRFDATSPMEWTSAKPLVCTFELLFSFRNSIAYLLSSFKFYQMFSLFLYVFVILFFTLQPPLRPLSPLSTLSPLPLSLYPPSLSIPPSLCDENDADRSGLFVIMATAIK